MSKVDTGTYHMSVIPRNETALPRDQLQSTNSLSLSANEAPASVSPAKRLTVGAGLSDLPVTLTL